MKREITETTTKIGTAMLLIKLIFLFPLFLVAQTDTTTTLTFDFNEHEIKENNNKVKIKPVGVSLTYDRFGNENSALYLHGHAFSYLNLGTSKLLKPRAGTISIWVNMERRLYLGRGYPNNPFIFTKNSANDDFYDGYIIGYECGNGRVGVCISQDSLKEVVVYTIEKAPIGKWNHFVLTFDDHNMAFYMNGKLQGKCKKDFTNLYSPTDSVLVGLLTSKKNERYFLGVMDDIQYFHRMLTEKQVKDLYEAPNPNKNQIFLYNTLKFAAVIAFVVLLSFLLVANRRRKLRKETEKYMLKSKMNEMEMKIIKAQMNPHFISNCLVAIQNLVYINKNDKAINYIAKFNYFLRQILKYSDENYISLAEEVEMIRLYIELEQLRFESGFTFELRQDPAVDYTDVMIPSLITQPFIENAIWHGLLRLEELKDAKLIIRVIKKAEIIIIEIEDNGVGRDLSKDEIIGKGTQLVLDKIESLNRLAGNNHYKIEIIDKFDATKKPSGTKIIIYLEN